MIGMQKCKVKHSAPKCIGEREQEIKKVWKHPFVWILQMYILVSDEHANITELIPSLWKPGHGRSVVSSNTFHCCITPVRAGPTIFRIFRNYWWNI